MKDPEPNDLLWRGLRGELSDEEKSRLESLISLDARLKSEWEEQLALNELLAKVPDAPVSSNFTALVMQAVEKERRETVRPVSSFRGLRFGVVRVAAGLALVLMIGLGLHNRYQRSQRTELAGGLKDLTAVASVIDKKSPAMETLQDFEAIRKLSRVPAVGELDMELLLALEK